jgi:hypothetical protein
MKSCCRKINTGNSKLKVTLAVMVICPIQAKKQVTRVGGDFYMMLKE